MYKSTTLSLTMDFEALSKQSRIFQGLNSVILVTSGGEAGRLIGLISGVISIIEGTEKFKMPL